MAPAPRPLPYELRVAPFTPADARAAGIPRRRLRARDLDDRVYGVRVAGGSTDDLRTRCLAFSTRLGVDVFFSHSTAARLRGAPLPLHLERLADLHVSVQAPARAPHATGIRGHARQVIPGDVVDLHGLRVSSPARLWCEMGRTLDLFDLVALTDYLIHHRHPWVSAQDLGARLAAGDRITRTRRLAAALEHCDERAESPAESRLRVMCAIAGLPAPSVNHELVTTVTGQAVRLDLAWPDRKFAIEYQGDGHRTTAQWRKDMTRREDLRLDEWRILELNADDLRDPASLVMRIRRALGQR